MKVDRLKINPNNPQTFTDQAIETLMASIRDFPKMMALRPMVYDPKPMHVLGGNKRLLSIQKLGMKEIPDEWVKSAEELTEDEMKRFIVQDNIQAGDWDWEELASDYESEELEEWGLEAPGFVVDGEFGEDFSLPDGHKEPFQQMTFTLADKQAIHIQDLIKKAKQTDEFKQVETFGNENSNGNALYHLLSEQS